MKGAWLSLSLWLTPLVATVSQADDGQATGCRDGVIEGVQYAKVGGQGVRYGVSG